MSKKFVASYSGGKDSVLAFYKAKQQGMTPLALITTFNTDKKRSRFHRIPEPVLESIAESIGVPVWLIKTSGDEYAKNFEEKLRFAKEQGAEVCVFGDIDIKGHIEWCTERCEKTGLEPVFPLYGQKRETVVNDFIDCGFTAHITIIDTTRVSGDILGKPLTKETLNELQTLGVDLCGENGEYHTFVSDGPIFKKPIEYSYGQMTAENGCAILPLTASKR